MNGFETYLALTAVVIGAQALYLLALRIYRHDFLLLTPAGWLTLAATGWVLAGNHHATAVLGGLLACTCLIAGHLQPDPEREKWLQLLKTDEPLLGAHHIDEGGRDQVEWIEDLAARLGIVIWNTGGEAGQEQGYDMADDAAALEFRFYDRDDHMRFQGEGVTGLGPFEFGSDWDWIGPTYRQMLWDTLRDQARAQYQIAIPQSDFPTLIDCLIRAIHQGEMEPAV